MITLECVPDKRKVEMATWWKNFLDEHPIGSNRVILNEWGGYLNSDEDGWYVIEFENEKQATLFLLRWA